jgi:hypothetical protein
MDEPSLSEHEQRILEEIERNLAEEDHDFARKLRSPIASRSSSQTLRLGIFGLILGLGFLLGFTVHTAFGVLGFLVMLAGAVAVGTAMRSITEQRAREGKLRDALKRAEGRMRFRRKDR